MPSPRPLSRSADAAVRFEGLPTGLNALVAVPAAQRKSITVDVRLPDLESAEPVRALTASAGAAHTRVRLILAPDTPPGAYSGTVHAPLGDMPAVIVVRDRAHLTVVPSSLRITATPGGELSQQLTVANAGNVPCTISRTFGFGLFATDGLDRAVGAGLIANSTGLDRLATIADSAAAGHGGLVRLVIRDGAGVINPGESRQLAAEMHFSSRLEPGRQYFATWRLHDLCVAISVEVAEPPPGTREPQS